MLLEHWFDAPLYLVFAMIRVVQTPSRRCKLLLSICQVRVLAHFSRLEHAGGNLFANVDCILVVLRWIDAGRDSSDQMRSWFSRSMIVLASLDGVVDRGDDCCKRCCSSSQDGAEGHGCQQMHDDLEVSVKLEVSLIACVGVELFERKRNGLGNGLVFMLLLQECTRSSTEPAHTFGFHDEADSKAKADIGTCSNEQVAICCVTPILSRMTFEGPTWNRVLRKCYTMASATIELVNNDMAHMIDIRC